MTFCSRDEVAEAAIEISHSMFSGHGQYYTATVHPSETDDIPYQLLPSTELLCIKADLQVFGSGREKLGPESCCDCSWL